MTDPHDPNSIPMLTDVIVPGRPPIGRQAETPSESPSDSPAETSAAARPQPEVAASSSEQPGAHTSAFDARDVEFIAERLRSRFSAYLRQDVRGVVEAHCRDAIQEHTNWLVRQVTREVVSALEHEVAGWVRDAVSEELARHTSRR
ncbi:DUF2486 family protein [Trinickia dinghuensis]|uniref:DUF2486 family protein n=1 Tax=Trinickia dinghuensis TaxID=2291023 RepID=A0A3D8JU55_9BURK|nr:DUF2486 family protein [Trinickia dinghuensis]RDU96607.1 DUF2486 family protein [Trinickia dinghuensis]